MGALDIRHYLTWTGLQHALSAITAMMCLFSLDMIKSFNMDFVVKVLAGFKLASLN